MDVPVTPPFSNAVSDVIGAGGSNIPPSAQAGPPGSQAQAVFNIKFHVHSESRRLNDALPIV